MYHFSMENKRYLVIDLEATCFDASSIDQRYADDVPISREDMEIIEIGAVWSSQSGAILDKFQVFVRPCWRRFKTDHLCRLNIDQGLLLT